MILIIYLICILFLFPFATSSIFDSKKEINGIGQIPSQIISNLSADCNNGSSSSGTTKSTEGQPVDGAGVEGELLETSTMLVTSTYSYLIPKTTATCQPTATTTKTGESSSSGVVEGIPTTAPSVELVTYTVMESITTTKCSYSNLITVTSTNLFVCPSPAPTPSTVTLAPPPPPPPPFKSLVKEEEKRVEPMQTITTTTTTTTSTSTASESTKSKAEKPKCTTETTTYINKTTKCVASTTEPKPSSSTPSKKDNNTNKKEKDPKVKESLQEFCSKNARKERIKTKNLLKQQQQQQQQQNIHSTKLTNISNSNLTPYQPASSQQDKSNAHLLIPYPFEPPKECSFMFLRMLRLNIYYYVRDVLSLPIDIDNIRLTNCELQTEIDDDEHSITADVELKNVDQNVAGKIEVALERIEPGSRAPKFTCSQIRSIEEHIPDMGINAFNCMPMKNRDLEKGRFSVSFLRKLVGLGILGTLLVYFIYAYIQWNQLQRNTADYFMLV